MLLHPIAVQHDRALTVEEENPHGHAPEDSGVYQVQAYIKQLQKVPKRKLRATHLRTISKGYAVAIGVRVWLTLNRRNEDQRHHTRDPVHSA